MLVVKEEALMKTARFVLTLAILLVFSVGVHAFDGFITMEDGYFVDAATGEPWVPHGIAYQTWNRPLGVWQTYEQIDYDLDEIVKMGGNSVRIDMVWQHIEGDGATSVAEGDNNFDWEKYDYFVQACEERGLRIFALIGYQWPPNWFPDEWYTMHPPEIDAEGIEHTNRWQSDIINYEHPEARAQYAEWLGAVAGHFKDSKAIVGWIVGNESGYLGLWSGLLDGYDPESEQAFRDWCENKYGTIAAANAEWGSSFASFDDVVFVEQYRAYGVEGAIWADMVQWREDSIASFTAVGAVGAKQADTNHLISYSTVGMQWGEEDWRYHAEDRGKITTECIASNAPIDFFSVNNYPWSVLGHESQNGHWGISYTKKVAKVPVLYSETGFTSSETMWPGMNEYRQGPLVRNALWESLEAGAVGTHIFSWMDRPYITDREKGFGIVYADRRVKPALWTSKEAYNLMEQVDIHGLLMGSEDPTPDIAFLWTAANDSQYNRYECEMQQVAGALERLGYEPNFIDLQDLADGAYTDYEAVILPRNMRVEDTVPGYTNSILNFLLTHVIPAGVDVMATADLPGMQDFNGTPRAEFEHEMDELFGVDVSDIGGFEAPMRRNEYVSWHWKLIEVDFNANSPIDGYHCWPQVWKYSDEIEVTDGTLWATMDSGRNKGFEDSDTEVVKWDGTWGNVDVRSGWGWAYDGNNMIQMWGDSGIWKDQAVVPFGRYTHSAFLRSNSDDPLAGGAEAYVAIEWYDEDGNLLSTSESAHLTSATPGDGWVEYKIDTTAPADAWTARRIVRVANPGTGSVYVDHKTRSPAVVVKDHGTAKAGIFLFSAGDQKPDGDFDGDPDVYPWLWRYDYFGAMVKDYFGIDPQVEVLGTDAYLCLAEHRILEDGSTLWQLKNYMYDTNYPASPVDPIGGGDPITFTLSSPLFEGKTVEAFYQAKIIEEDSDGTISVTLDPDGMEMLHVYDNENEKTEIQGSWDADRQVTSPTWSDSGVQASTFRILLEGSVITNSGNRAYLTVHGRNSGSYTLNRVSLVKRDGATMNGIDETFTEVTFGSDWDTGVTVPANTQVTSDPIDMPVTAGEDLFLTYWVPAGQPTVYRTGGSQNMQWDIASDQSTTIDWEGLSLTARAYVYVADHLDVEVGVGSGYAIGSSDGRMWGVDNGRRNATDEGPASFPLSNVYTTYYSYARGPIVVGDRMYAVANYFSHMIKCWDAQTGSNIWSYTSPNGTAETFVPRSLAIADGVLFATTKNNSGGTNPTGSLYAIDATTGDVLWNVNNPSNSFNAVMPVVKDGVAYTAFIADRVRAFYADSGIEKWAATNYTSASHYAGLAAGADNVYQIVGGYLAAYDLETGARQFRVYINRSGWAESAPVVVGDRVYVARNEGSGGVGVYDAADGSLLWEYTGFSLDKFCAPAVGEGIMAIVAETTNEVGTLKVLAFDADQAGAPLWTYALSGDAYSSITPIIANGAVYVNDDGGLYVLDAATGSLLYSKAHGGSTYEPFVKNGWVFVPHGNGRIEALSDGSPWPVPEVSGTEIVTIQDTPAVVHPFGDKSYLVKVGYDCRDKTDLTLKLAFCESGDNGDGEADEVYEQLEAAVLGNGTQEFWLWVPDADQNDSDYISTPDGGQYVFRAWLEDADTNVVVEAVPVPTELEWGVRPTAPLPTNLVKGSQYEIPIEWEDLYEYLPWEVTPMSRNDAFPNRIALVRSTKTEAQYPGHLDKVNQVADWLESLGYENGNPLDVSFDNIEVLGEGALVPVSAWTADAQQGSGSWGNSGWENRTFRVLIEGSSITRDGDTCYLTLKGRTSGSYNARRVSLVRRDGTTLDGVDSTFAQVTFGGTWDDGAVVPANGTITSDPIDFDLVAGQDVFMTYWGDPGLPTVYRSGTSSDMHTWTISSVDHTATIDWQPLSITGGQNAHVYAAYSLDVLGVGDGPIDVNFNTYTVQGYGGSQDINSSQYEVLDGGATLHMWGNNWKCVALPYDVTPDTVIEFDFMADGVQGEINGIGFDTDLGISANLLFQLWGTQTWGLSPYRNYPGSGWVHYSIPVGQYYTGSYIYMMFANDADAGQATSCYFKNVQVHEGSTGAGSMLADDFSGDLSNWTRAAGAANWELDNETLRASRIGNSDNIFVAGDANWSNYTMSADIRYNAQGPYFSDAEMYVRYLDRDNFVKVGIRNFYGFWRLKYLVRENTNIVSQGWIHEFSKTNRPVENTWYNLAVDVAGDTYTVSFDGEEVGQFVATNFASGKIAVGSMATQLGIWEPQKGYYFVDDDEYSFWAPEGQAQLQGRPLNLDWGYLDAFYPTLVLPGTYVMSDEEVQNVQTWINGGLRCLIATDGGVAIKDETGATDLGRIEDLFGVGTAVTSVSGLNTLTVGDDGHYVTLDYEADDAIGINSSAQAWTDIADGTALAVADNGSQSVPALIVNTLTNDPLSPKKVFCFNMDAAGQLDGALDQIAQRAFEWAQGEAYKVRLELKYPSPLGDVNVDIALLTIDGWLLSESGTNTLIVDIPEDGIMTGDDLYWVLYVYAWDAADPWLAHGGFYSSENDSDGGISASLPGQGLQILGINGSAFGGREWDTWVAYNTRGETLDLTFGVKEKGSLLDEFAFTNAGNYAGWTITPNPNIFWSGTASDTLRADVVGTGGYSYITRDGLDLSDRNITFEYDVYFSGSAATNGGILYRGVVLYANPAMAGWADGSLDSYDETGLDLYGWHRVALSIRDGDPFLVSDLYVDGEPVFVNEPIETTNWSSTTAGFLSPYYGGYCEWDNVRFVDEEYSFVTLESLSGEVVPTNENEASFYTWVPDYDPDWWEFDGTAMGGEYEWYVYFRGAGVHSRSNVNIYFSPRLMVEDPAFPTDLEAGETVSVGVDWEGLGTNVPCILNVGLQHVDSAARYGETEITVTEPDGFTYVDVAIDSDALNGDYMWAAYMYPPTATDPYLERLGYDDTYRSKPDGTPLEPETAVTLSGNSDGVFTVFSDAGLAQGSDLFKWPSGANVDAHYTIYPPPEGVESCYALSFIDYIGWGVFKTSGTYDMSSFEGGELRFWVWSFETLKVEVEGPRWTKGSVDIPSTGGTWQEVSIPLSQFGAVDLSQIYGLFMVTSYDGAEYMIDHVRWIPPAAENATEIDFSASPILRYDTSQDANSTQYEVLDGGDTLHMWGNNWKCVDLTSYTVTADTVLEFDFMSDGAEGEINGSGLDTDLYISSPYTFKVYGTQAWGLSNYDNYPGSGWTHYEIPIGQFYTGTRRYLFFVNDADAGQNTSVYYKNVRLVEP
jgi:hypothetical protein